MVAVTSTFDTVDFAVAPPDVWYVQKPEWIRGPFSFQDMSRFRDLGWLSRSEAVSQDLHIWTPAVAIALLWATADSADHDRCPNPPEVLVPATQWRYIIDGKPQDEPASFATLQMLASLGWLHQDYLVWRERWPDWRSSRDVAGLHTGPPECCTACGAQVSPHDVSCLSCRARLPGSAPPHAEMCMACGVLGVVLFPVFPLWIIAFTLGSHDAAQIASDRMDSRGQHAARFGVRMGVLGGSICALTAVAAIVFAVVQQ